MMTSLPKPWLDKQGLGKGDTVSLTVTEKGILVESSHVSKDRELSFDMKTEAQNAVKTLVTNAYRAGFDTITVQYETKTTYQHISDTVTDVLLGFDITEKTSDACTIEALTEPSNKTYDELIQKIFHNIGVLFDKANQAFQTEESVDDIDDIERRIYQYKNVCKRIINKHRALEDTAGFHTVLLTKLTHAQRELYHGVQAKKEPSQHIQSLIEDTETMFRTIQDAWQQKSKQPLTDTHSLEQSVIHNHGYHVLENDPNKASATRIIAAARQFYQTNSSLSGVLFLSE